MMMRFDYSAEKGHLIIREAPTGRIIKSASFEAPVLQVLPSPKGNGCLVLLDPSAINTPTYANLFMVGPDGVVDWTVVLPGSHDAFVAVVERDGHVEARTWNGQSVEIDLENGQTLNIRFVK